MDAQNAAQSDQTRPAGATPPSQRDAASSPASASASAAAPVPAPVNFRPGSPPLGSDKKDEKSREREKQKEAEKENDRPKDRNASKASAAPSSTTIESSVTVATTAEPTGSDERDSDAETIVLPGKDGHSPSKVRKVRQEDRSDGDIDGTNKTAAKIFGSGEAERPSGLSRVADSLGLKKKRLTGIVDRDSNLPRSKDGSSGLSSAPTSPPHNQRRRRSDDPRSSSDSDHPRQKLPSKSSLRDKLKSGERLLPHKRKMPKHESDDEADVRKVRRQRTTSAGVDSMRSQKEIKHFSKSDHDPDTRSTSPQARSHRRSASSQLPSYSSNGFGQKKKRLPPPLSTDYHSDESSASGSPHFRSSKLRNLANSTGVDSAVSPAKVAPHKKHLDAHGQTLLARACARGEYEGAKQRLGERPEDLNVADYAGNTPLQIAAINGCEDIVKLLIDAGCNLDCVNYDKDTPLLDAVDNGHVGVVKLLLDAGVNPRKANVNGEEPVDRVSDDTDNAEEIRAALMEARKRAGERRRTSEDRHSHHDYHDARDSHAPESPRQSPARLSAATNRRTGTVRSTKTRNDLLYMPLDDKTLRQAAGRGDEETVARILQVKEGYDDPESMVAAARGGHDLVIQLLLGLGGARPDPPAVSSLPSEFATPILAAIGQENIKVIDLLLEQQGFDPTRRYKGETYYELARRRQGTNWKEEEQLLKNAYDAYKRGHKDGKNKSPVRKERGREREERDAKRAKRAEAKEEARVQKRSMSSPSRDFEPKKKSAARLTSPKEKRKSDALPSHGDETVPKRGPGRPKKEDRIPSINVSDRELSPTMSHKQLKAKRTESDHAGVSSEGETMKPRRKLVSKGELRGEREKQRRASMASNTSSLKDHPLSPHDSRHDETVEKQRADKLSEKYHDRTKALKRDESRDRLAVSGDGSSKRHRNSITPDRPSNGDKDENEMPPKRRRLDSEMKEKRQRQSASSDERPRKPNASQDTSSIKAPTKSSHKNMDNDRKESQSHLKRRDSGRSSNSEKIIHVKSEEFDVEMKDADTIRAMTDADILAAEEEEAEKERLRLVEEEAEETKKQEEERRLREEKEKEKEREKEKEQERERERERERQQLEAARQKEEEERKRKEDKQEADRKRQQEDERKRKQEEAQRQAAEEKARREGEEEKRRLEEEKRRDEEERARKQREEEERIRKEQLEQEAAEEARRQREEEERKERERRERAHREELEKKRAAREAEQRRIREEQEALRLDKLPPLLRWLDTCPNPKLPELAEKFKRMQGVRYDTIRSEANQKPEGREQWVLNTHVALLLGEKDLDLSRYTAWERVPATQLAKKSLWRREWNLYSLVSEKLWDLGQQLPGYYGDEEPASMCFQTKERLRMEAWERFANLDMFFVKVSDLMYTIPNVPHLRNIQLAVEYRELMETEAQGMGWKTTQKWKQDPDAARFHGFAPRHKYYANGVMVGEEMPSLHQTSKEPFHEKRVPRRGLIQVHPDDPDYARLCLEQGLAHLLNGASVSPTAPTRVNGTHSSPASQISSVPSHPNVNGINKTTAHSTTTNGGLPNGIHGS